MKPNLIVKPYKILLFIYATLIIICNNTYAMEEPKELIINDIEVGEGRTAVKGKEVAVHYTGWLFDSELEVSNPCEAKGKQFDSSIDRGMPFQLSLGQGMVIQGWEEGLIGMKEERGASLFHHQWGMVIEL